jgi:signal transduction histidine kinase
VLEIDRDKANEAAKPSTHSSYSFSDLHNKRSRVEVVIVNASKRQINNQNYYLFYIDDISDVLSAGLMKMQKKFQITLTNGLSHERLTPLNGILLNTELVLNKCEVDLAKHSLVV